jgi:hypothetical protein
MNNPRDLKGRYIKTKPKILIRVPSNMFGGRKNPPIKLVDRYRKIGVISIQRAKVVYEETKTESTIENKIETSTIVGHEERPFGPSSEPSNTTVSFSTP